MIMGFNIIFQGKVETGNENFLAEVQKLVLVAPELDILKFYGVIFPPMVDSLRAIDLEPSAVHALVTVASNPQKYFESELYKSINHKGYYYTLITDLAILIDTSIRFPALIVSFERANYP